MHKSLSLMLGKMKSKWILKFFIFLFLVVRAESMVNVPFDVSMQSVVANYQYNPNDARWQFLKSLYEKYQNEFSLSDQYVIPKWIHFIWLGSPLPSRCEAMVDTWKKYHPDWTIKVWTEEDLSSFDFINRIAFDRAQNYAEKSDIWRYEILNQFGGMYVDTDFECLQSFDELHRSCEFYLGIGQHKNPELLNSIIGSRADHPILKALIKNVPIGPGDNDSWRILRDTGPYFLTQIFFDVAPTCLPSTIVTFPTTFFFPFPGYHRQRQDKENIKREFVKPESMAIHYFAASWQL